jgi:thioredoxin 1
MINEPIHVTDAAFEKTVLQSPVPVIVDFWATWCTPCKAIAPILEKLATEYAGKLIIAKLDIDANPDTAMKYGVQSIPTLLFVAKGKVLNRQVGSAPEANIRMAVEQFLQVAG